MKLQVAYTLIILSSIWITSCDRPECTNENPVFENSEPNSKIYKDELVKQLNTVDQTKLRYWLQKYDEQNEEESLCFYIQGEGLCAVLHLSMNHWDKMEEIREKKGVGRRGAEFTNLKYEISQDDQSTSFIYTTFDSMID